MSDSESEEEEDIYQPGPKMEVVRTKEVKLLPVTLEDAVEELELVCQPPPPFLPHPEGHSPSLRLRNPSPSPASWPACTTGRQAHQHVCSALPTNLDWYQDTFNTGLHTRRRLISSVVWLQI